MEPPVLGAGWKVAHLHGAAVIHYGNQTIQGNPRFKPEYVKGTPNYFRRHRSAASYHALRALGAVVVLGRWLWGRANRDQARALAMRRSLAVLLVR